MRHPFIALLALAAFSGLALVLWAGALSPWLDAFRQFWPLWMFLAGLATLLVWPNRETRARWGMLILLIAIAAPGAPETLRAMNRADRLNDGDGLDIHIATQNMWGRNATPQRLVEHLPEIAPDVLALQESYGNSRTAGIELANLYPHAAQCRSTRILTRFEILDSGCIEAPGPIDWATSIPCEWEVPPAVWARVQLPDGSAAVLVSVHLTWPIPGDTHYCQARNLGLALAQMPQERMIVLGDFNAASPSFALQRIALGLGIERRSIGIATFPSQGRLSDGGTPMPIDPMLVGIDHIFAGPDWQTVHVGTGPDTGSDHRPLMATLRLRP